MKRLLILSTVLLSAALGMATPAPARCSFCYSGECLNSSICGQGCRCWKRGYDSLGVCMSSDFEGGSK
jgi:hypothetical protein